MPSASLPARFAPMFPDPQRRRIAVTAWLTMATDDDLCAAFDALTDERLGTIASFAEATLQERHITRHEKRCRSFGPEVA